MRSVSAERNKSRVLDLIERVMNGHDADALAETQQGPWLFVQEPPGSVVETAFLLAFRFDDDGQIIDQWLGSNFVEMLAQLGWGSAPIGQTAALPH
jgi:hypothetical protein